MSRALTAFLLFSATCLGASTSSFDSTIQPFLVKNCLTCHSERAHAGDLNLESFHSREDVDAKRDLWEVVIARVRSGEMPPKGLPRPTPDQVQSFTSWVEEEFARLDKNLKPDPGRVTARRLNRFEYNNTIRDLFGVKFRPASDFPADDSGYGFDNIGDVLSLSPVLLDKYLTAATRIANSVIPGDTLPKATLERHKRTPNVHPLPDEYAQPHSFPTEGEYEVHVNITGRRIPLNLALLLDGKQVGDYVVPAGRDVARRGEFRIHVPYGEHTLTGVLTSDPTRSFDDSPVATPKPGQKPPAPVPEPNLNYIEVRGPYNPLPPPMPEGYKRLFVCGHPKGQHKPECARLALANMTRLAYRRPVSKQEVDGLVHFVALAQERGDSFEQGMRVALEAMLVSPHFLFRIERDQNPNDARATHPVNDYELASRLSYFLWSSMPDAELFRTAEQHRLRKPEILDAQVKRMLADSKSSAMVENFAGQWLELRNLNSVKPDPDKFPAFTPELRADMLRETQMFFEAIIRQNRSILDFLDGSYTFLNERLAKFYGIPGVQGDQFRRVDLAPYPERSGVLTQASILTVSSYPNRTSPVIRGKYILENFLNDPPPPPPPGVPSLDESTVGLAQSMRKQLEAHRANPACAACHSRMDPLGFGFENYDAIGQWRTADGKFPIDSTGTLPSGKSFQTAAQLKQILKSNSMAFTQCMTEKLLTYGLGRGLERFDRPAIQSISRKTAAAGYKFDDLILEIVNSMPFQMRRGEIDKTHSEAP